MTVRKSVYNKLIQLVKDDNSAGLRFFLRWESDRRGYLHYRNNDGLTLLHQACLLGKRNVVHALVECGSDIEGRSSIGWTALHAAALSGCYDVVAYLIKTCASNVTAEDDMGCKPINLTLGPQIMALLHEKSEEVLLRAAEEKRKFQKISESVRSINITQKQSLHGISETSYPHNRRGTFVLNYIKFCDNKSGVAQSKMNRKELHHMRKSTQYSEDDSDRDSGIYDDFADTRSSSSPDGVSKNSYQIVLATRSSRTTIV